MSTEGGGHARGSFLMAAVVGFGVTTLVVFVALGALLISRGFDSGSTDSGTAESVSSSPQADQERGANLRLSTASAAVLEDVVATASLTSPGDVGTWTLQVLGEGTWEDLATAQPDAQGALSYLIRAPEVAGEYLYRVVLFDPQRVVTASSDAVELVVERLPTLQVAVSWPKRPADYCVSVGVPVEVSPAAARPVILQSSPDGRTWVDTATATTNTAGQARIDTPPCDDGTDGDLGSLKWRVVAPETPTYGQEQSKAGMISWCPAPSDVPFQTVSINEFLPLTVDVTNPSTDCAAMVTIAAEFVCYADVLDGPLDPLIIGYRQSTPPMYVGPGETRNFDPAEVFTDSQRRCQDYYPFFDIYARPDTIRAWADSFTAP